MNISICGIDCDACNFKKDGKCEGCRISAAKGECVWGGRCELHDCAAEKKLPHCGKCDDFPCAKLIEAHKNENPDGNGIEIENLKTLNRMRFVQIYKDNTKLYQELLPIWCDYMKELDGEDGDTPNETIIKDLQRRINNQGSRENMHLELFYFDDVFVGFAHFAIATGSLYGLLEPGNGFVMEFYIIPKHRRKGYGKILYNHVEEVLIKDGAKHICLTANHATGEPFWIAVGYTDTGKIDTDNDLPVYLKSMK